MSLSEHLKDYLGVASITSGQVQLGLQELEIHCKDSSGGTLSLRAKQITPAVELLDAVARDQEGKPRGRVRLLNPNFMLSPDTIKISDPQGDIIIGSQTPATIHHFSNPTA